MVKIYIDELILSFQDSNFLWILIPIFFIGIITDKYQEEFKTSVGNAISNGALIIFSGFSWIQLIFYRQNFPPDATISQFMLSALIILYGFTIIASGFKTGEFARTYGRIRVVTFMLMFFTTIIYIPILYNIVSVIIFVLLFPFYYAFISELVKVMPSAHSQTSKNIKKLNLSNLSVSQKIMFIGKTKLKEYLE